MNKETVDFYDKESSVYTTKRYPKVTQSYIQYLFKKRMSLFLDMLDGALSVLPEHPTMLEIGCADGIVFKAIEEKFPGKFKKLVGIDVSPQMITEAEKNNNNNRAKFYMRDDLPEEKFDVVIELGVHPFNLDTELSYVIEHLNSNSFFFYSVVSSDSFYLKIKHSDAYYIKDYRRYEEYESVFLKYFSVKTSALYGFFIPKLWAWPVLARKVQPVFDDLFWHFVPNLFHEKIYALRSKTK